MIFFRTGSLCLGCMALFLVAGCTSEPQSAAGNPAKAESEEYADYVPTGSHIPAKVKKQNLRPSADKTAQDQELMRKMQIEQPDPAGPLPK